MTGPQNTEDIKTDYLNKAKDLFELNGYELQEVAGHEGGRNEIYICTLGGEKKYVLRISATGDRTEEEYLAETEFVHYLAANGASIADVVPSKSGRLVESFTADGKTIFVSLFEYAKGMLLSDNGYRYREGAPLTELFYNMGKTIGAIHRLSKVYKPTHRRAEYFDKYNMDCINTVISDEYAELKAAIEERFAEFRSLPMDAESYGLVDFDFSDGNYHVDMTNGDIVTFDFDNCINCWYMFDLAHLWTHGVGWCQWMQSGEERLRYMKDVYFASILQGYRSETGVSEELLSKLPLFIDMVLIEGVVDEFECAAREGEDVDPEDIEDYATCLTEHIPYAGIGVDL